MFPSFLEASWTAWAILLASIGALAWLVMQIRAWCREDEDPRAHAQEMLLQFGDLRREGHLSDEEFRSIKSQLTRSQNPMSAQDGRTDQPIESMTESDRSLS